MAAQFVIVDRNTPMLLPPDLRDWVDEDDLVHFVIEAVERLPLETFKTNHRGRGHAQMPPHMMLALLIYCYSNGIFSSRKIERSTYRDVSVRYLTADTHPDHDTICKFRRENLAAISTAFVEVLQLAREMGLLKLGKVSTDGTHIKASAAMSRNIGYQRANGLKATLQRDIEALLEKAEGADQSDQDEQQLPAQIARREKAPAMQTSCCRPISASTPNWDRQRLKQSSTLSKKSCASGLSCFGGSRKSEASGNWFASPTTASACTKSYNREKYRHQPLCNSSKTSKSTNNRLQMFDSNELTSEVLSMSGLRRKIGKKLGAEFFFNPTDS